MEDKWNPNESELESEELLDVEDSPEAEEEVLEYTDEEPEIYEGELMSEEPEEEPEPPKPKPKKKSFKKKLRRAIRRFFKLPLLTRCIMAGLLVAIIAVIIVLLVVIPKNCKASAGTKGDVVVASAEPSAEPEATPEQIPTTTASTPTNPPASPIPRLSDTIKPNTSNDIIPFIRTLLVDLGYMKMPESNDVLYDQATVNAVKRFQYRNFPDNIKEWDGYIGTKTYEKMLATDAMAFYMKSGDTDKKLYDSELVTELQLQLIATGYLKSASANGNYDQATVDAVRRFQKDNSLKSDGVAGQSTLKLLAQKVAEVAQPSAEPAETTPNQ